MKLNELKPARGATHSRKRLGHGTGSGHGGTSTRGHKGQYSRSGGGRPAWFEGGQMPLQRRIPKRGFKQPNRHVFQVVNLIDLARFAAGTSVTLEDLRGAGLIRKNGLPVKILGMGDLPHALTVQAHAASKSAVEKIEQSGGKVELLTQG
ncbi:MAG: 50S ribosomal protein L15 [Candidatus Eisenbacteria bacterium]